MTGNPAAAARRGIRLRDLGLLPLLPLWVAGGSLAWHAINLYRTHGTFGIDAHAYWLTHQHAHLYGLIPGSPNAFLYTPAFAQAILPLAHLPWHVFQAAWMALEIGAYIWLFAPLGWRWWVPLILLCSVEIGLGNIYPLLAVAAVVGLRRPAAWAFPLLTKITPGVGILWFAVRKEWRQLGWAVAATLAVTAVSLLMSPRDWSDWLHFTTANAGHGQLLFPVRLLAAVAVVFVAARFDRAWLLAPAMLLACPVLQDISPLAMLAAIPRLRQHDYDARARPADLSWFEVLPPDMHATSPQAVSGGGLGGGR
jgi:Glycosyltransferase family 87